MTLDELLADLVPGYAREVNEITSLRQRKPPVLASWPAAGRRADLGLGGPGLVSVGRPACVRLGTRPGPCCGGSQEPSRPPSTGGAACSARR